MVTGEVEPEALAYTLMEAKLGKTVNSNHAAVINAVFTRQSSEVEFYEAASAGSARSPLVLSSNAINKVGRQ
jgi:hypothetical protein